jgi:hypothetical protein
VNSPIGGLLGVIGGWRQAYRSWLASGLRDRLLDGTKYAFAGPIQHLYADPVAEAQERGPWRAVLDLLERAALGEAGAAARAVAVRDRARAEDRAGAGAAQSNARGRSGPSNAVQAVGGWR